MQSAKNLLPQPSKLTLDYVLTALVAERLITRDQAQKVSAQTGEMAEYPLTIISKFGLRSLVAPNLPITIDFLMEWLAKHCELPLYEIDPVKIDLKTVLQVLPIAYMRRLSVVPVKIEAKEMWIATSDPFAHDWIDQVESVTKKQVHLVLSSPHKIRFFIEEFSTIRSATKDFAAEHAKDTYQYGRVVELERMLGKAKGNDLGKDAAAVIRIVDWLFQFAHDERATDIHLEPKKGKGQVRFRIDGQMRIVYNFDPALMVPVVTRLKLLSEMLIDEKRKPQDGRLRYKLAKGQELEMRLSSIPAQHGEKIVVRIFDPKMAGGNFEELGFESHDIATWEKLINAPHGIVLVTGPTGSGKSTTLHTSLRKIVRDDVNICTIEDPIEIVNDDLNQVQVNSKIDLTFAEAIRAFLRQDPDVIMVGEIRDQDAARMAIQAALTGHLVLSTLHTNDAISSITRLIDLGIPPHLITASVRGMMAQRLVRRLCEFCKKQTPIDQLQWREFCGNDQFAKPESVCEPVGCNECKRTGYRGRLCVYEIVLMDQALKSAVRKNVAIDELMAAVRGKFTPLKINGIGKVFAGHTSMEEVTRVIF